MSHYAQQRKERINAIKSQIEDEDEIKHKKLLADASITMGISNDKTEEYLETLVDGEYVEIVEEDDVKLVRSVE